MSKRRGVEVPFAPLEPSREHEMPAPPTPTYVQDETDSTSVE